MITNGYYHCHSRCGDHHYHVINTALDNIVVARLNSLIMSNHINNNRGTATDARSLPCCRQSYNEMSRTSGRFRASAGNDVLPQEVCNLLVTKVLRMVQGSFAIRIAGLRWLQLQQGLNHGQLTCESRPHQGGEALLIVPLHLTPAVSNASTTFRWPMPAANMRAVKPSLWRASSWALAFPMPPPLANGRSQLRT